MDRVGTPERKHPLLSLRSVGIRNDVSLTSANATSAATAQAARLAALAMERYPSYWPETIRGLLVHEAQWTPAMQKQFNSRGAAKRERARLLRRYGWGVPTEESVLHSFSDAVTMVVQDQFKPFSKEWAMRELRLRSARSHRERQGFPCEDQSASARRRRSRLWGCSFQFGSREPLVPRCASPRSRLAPSG